MKNKLLCFVAIFILLSGCSNQSEPYAEMQSLYTVQSSNEESLREVPESTETESVTEPDAMEIYTSIMEAEYLDAEDAYEQIQGIESDDSRVQGLIEDTTWLHQCSGRFLQESEYGDKNYTADVVFYLKNGKIYCTIDYTGYIGTLEDAEVTPSERNGFHFEAFPDGKLFSVTHDFQVCFGEEQLYITWADTCEYTLTRGDGSAAVLDNPEKPFEETQLYEILMETIEQSFQDEDYAIWYDENENCVNIAIEVIGEAGKLRNLITTRNERGLELWSELVEEIEKFAGGLATIVSVGDEPRHTVLYIVDRIHSDNEYSENEYLLRVRDGKTVYNYADTVSVGTASARTSGIDSTASTSSATLGERNALSKARDYLDVMTFSYTGLIDQLEYEGYSYSEAVYGADHCGADWYEQAALKAAEYLDLMAFSRQGLIEQLEYEGFTYEQAVYGVEQNGY